MSLQFVEPSVPNFFQTPSFNQLFLTKVKPIDSSNCNLWADKTGLCNSVLNSGCLIAVGVITVVDCYRSCWWPILLPVSVGPFNRVSGARQQLSISWIESELFAVCPLFGFPLGGFPFSGGGGKLVWKMSFKLPGKLTNLSTDMEAHRPQRTAPIRVAKPM